MVMWDIWSTAECLLKVKILINVTVFISVHECKKGQEDVVVVVSTLYTRCSAYVNGNLGGIFSPRIEIRVNLPMSV